MIALRFKNIVAFALGKMDAWGLNTDAMGWDQWDHVHVTTWNFLPFLLRRVGVAPALGGEYDTGRLARGGCGAGSGFAAAAEEPAHGRVRQKKAARQLSTTSGSVLSETGTGNVRPGDEIHANP